MRARVGAVLQRLARPAPPPEPSPPGPAPYAPPVHHDVGRPALPAQPAPRTWDLRADEIEGFLRVLAATPAAELVRELGADELLAGMRADAVGIPAPEDREYYWWGSDLGYWAYGLGDCLFVEHVAARAGVPIADGTTVLDFGCSSGRVLRHLITRHPGASVLGADIATHAIDWLRMNLPSARAHLCAVLPPLPYRDASVDVVHAGSVFTHIGDLEEAWLEELARIIRPGGVLVATIHSDRTWEALRDGRADQLMATITNVPRRAEPIGVEPVEEAFFDQPMPTPRLVLRQLGYPVYNLLTFHSLDYVRGHWAPWFSLTDVVEGGHGPFQDALVLRPV